MFNGVHSGIPKVILVGLIVDESKSIIETLLLLVTESFGVDTQVDSFPATPVFTHWLTSEAKNFQSRPSLCAGHTLPGDPLVDRVRIDPEMRCDLVHG